MEIFWVNFGFLVGAAGCWKGGASTLSGGGGGKIAEEEAEETVAGKGDEADMIAGAVDLVVHMVGTTFVNSTGGLREVAVEAEENITEVWCVGGETVVIGTGTVDAKEEPGGKEFTDD